LKWRTFGPFIFILIKIKTIYNTSLCGGWILPGEIFIGGCPVSIKAFQYFLIMWIVVYNKGMDGWDVNWGKMHCRESSLVYVGLEWIRITNLTGYVFRVLIIIPLRIGTCTNVIEPHPVMELGRQNLTLPCCHAYLSVFIYFYFKYFTHFSPY
jgi:hypothetical protein